MMLTLFLFKFGGLWAQVPSYVPKDGLVGWYPFNGNANDESGNGNHGTVNRATLTSDRFGNSNKAYNFSGNQFIDLGAFSQFNGANKFTLSLWFKTNSAGNDILFCRGDWAQMNQFKGEVTTQGKLNFGCRIIGKPVPYTPLTLPTNSRDVF